MRGLARTAIALKPKTMLTESPSFANCQVSGTSTMRRFPYVYYVVAIIMSLIFSTLGVINR